MCFGFGENKQVEKKTTDTTLPAYLSNAAQQNVANAGNVTSQPFQAYTSPRVAGLSGDEQTAGNMLRTIAGSGNPYNSEIEQAYRTYANTPGAKLSLPSILGGGTDARTANITDYISPYIDAALRPTLEAIGRQGAQQRKGINARATMSGAFGDARHGVDDVGQGREEMSAVSNATGTAYDRGFTQAAGLRQQDLTSLFNTDKASADYGENALQRAITGGTALRDLDKYNTGREADLAGLLSKQGETERGIAQKGLDTDYGEFLRKLGYSGDMLKLMTSVLSASPGNKEGTQVASTEKPDNSGWGLVGSLAGTALTAATGLPMGQMFSGMSGPSGGSDYAGLGGWA